MDKKAEKLQLLSDLIDLAHSDNQFKEIEEHFLMNLAQHLGLDAEDYVKAKTNDNLGAYPKKETERILQFHRLVLVMNVDADTDAEELTFLKDLALKMGLNPMAVQKVLRVMHEYPNKVIPPNVLLSIFKEGFN